MHVRRVARAATRPSARRRHGAVALCSEPDDALDIRAVYCRIVAVMRLRNVQRLAIVLLVPHRARAACARAWRGCVHQRADGQLVRVGHVVFDTVTMLKLVDKGERTCVCVCVCVCLCCLLYTSPSPRD